MSTDSGAAVYGDALRNCLNRLARGTVECSDGRQLVLDWRATDCQVAFGTGFDKDGGIVQFSVIGDEEKARTSRLNLAAQLEPYPPLPLAVSR